MSNTEIEIQVKIENSKVLRSFLAANASFKYKTAQKDTYFTPAHREFTAVRPITEWLRLRDTEGKFVITYKKWHYDNDGRSHFCDEYEIKIDDYDKAHAVFKALDMKHLVTVEKIRDIYQFKNFEISLDEIKNLGSFVEIEYKGKEKKEPKEVTESMLNLLKEIGVGKIERNYLGYPFQLMFPKEIAWETVV